MRFIYISLVVLDESDILKNQLLRMNVSLEEEKAAEYLYDLEKWLELRPIPGQPYPALNATPQRPEESELPVDQTVVLANRLEDIIRRRDPFIFDESWDGVKGTTYERVVGKNRPYDRELSEVV